MRLYDAQEIQSLRSPHTIIYDRIVDIVVENGGIRETDLTVILIANFAETSLGDQISAEKILNIIQTVINQGRVVAIDCQIGDTGCTFLFPIGTQIRTVVPINDHRTQH